MGSKQQAATTTVQNNDPWAPTAPHLQSIMSQAQGLQASGAGTQQWGGPALAGLSGETQQGLNQTMNTANANVGAAAAPFQTAVNGLSNGGLNTSFNQPLNTLSGVSSGANRVNTGGAYGGLAALSLGQNEQPNSIMGDIAQNGALSGKDNPYLQTMLDDQSARTANKVNSSISRMGRYGSFGHGDQLARSITAANAPILAQSYENDQNRRLSDASLRANTAGSLAGSNRADVAGAQSALGGLTGVQGVNIANQMGAAGQQADIFNQGIQNQQNWANLSPALNNLQYDPSNRMLAVGGMQDARSQAELDNQRALFEQQQQQPWTQLANYAGAVSGLSPLMANAGTKTTVGNSTQQNNPGALATLMGLFGGGANSAAGGMLGFLSDENEKTDIKKIGKSEQTGLDIFTYRYKGDPKSYQKVVGPMAQDIRDKFPGSTVEINGKLAVKPEYAGLLGAL